MDPRDIVRTSRHPITRNITWRGYSYADVNGVIFSISPDHAGHGWHIGFSTAHLPGPPDSAPRTAWHNSEHGLATTFHIDSISRANTTIADYAHEESRAFELARHAWQTLTPDPAKLAAPYRILRRHAHWYEAVANDPRTLVSLTDGGTPTGNSIIATAVRFYARDGAIPGWIVAATSGHVHTDPIPRKGEALEALHAMAKECCADNARRADASARRAQEIPFHA